MLFFNITSRQDFVDILSLGFGYLVKEPWDVYQDMCNKYQEPCIDISYSHKSIIYAPKSYFIGKSYKQGTIEDVKRMCQAHNKDCQTKRGPGRPKKIP